MPADRRPADLGLCVHARSDLEKIAPQWLALSPAVRRFFTVTYPEVGKAALAVPLSCLCGRAHCRSPPAGPRPDDTA